MCRLGFISDEREDDVTNLVKLATTFYGYGNDDGTGFSYIDEEGNLKTIKTQEEAIKFWLKPENQNIDIKTKALIMHVRAASQGKVKLGNAHPFYDEKSGTSLVHNGTLFGETRLKEDLEKKGYVFEGDTDSEVVAKAYAEYGDKFTEVMDEYKVTGVATILILLKDGTIKAYTNNDSLKLWKTDKGITGFSDSAFFSDGVPIEVKPNVLYTIKDGNIESQQEITPIKSYSYGGYYSKGDNFGMGYNYQTKITPISHDVYDSFGMGEPSYTAEEAIEEKRLDDLRKWAALEKNRKKGGDSQIELAENERILPPEDLHEGISWTTGFQGSWWKEIWDPVSHAWKPTGERAPKPKRKRLNKLLKEKRYNPKILIDDEEPLWDVEFEAEKQKV